MEAIAKKMTEISGNGADERKPKIIIIHKRQNKNIKVCPRRPSENDKGARGPWALYQAQEYHCNLALFFFT